MLKPITRSTVEAKVTSA